MTIEELAERMRAIQLAAEQGNRFASQRFALMHDIQHAGLYCTYSQEAGNWKVLVMLDMSDPANSMLKDFVGGPR